MKGQVRQSSSGGATHNAPFPKVPQANTRKWAVKTGRPTVSAYDTTNKNAQFLNAFLMP